jgi:CarD family transcriptional regulator
MIPMDNIDALGIRNIIDKDKVQQVLTVLSQNPTEMNKVWTKRYRENERKIKNGDIFDICEIVRNLITLDRSKKLSSGEKKILAKAKGILVSELMLALNVESQEVEEILENAVK